MTADPAPHEMTPADAFMAAEAALMELDAMARGVLVDVTYEEEDDGTGWSWSDTDHAIVRLDDAVRCLHRMTPSGEAEMRRDRGYKFLNPTEEDIFDTPITDTPFRHKGA